MKKINIVKKNEEFNRIIKNNKPYKTKEFYIFVERVEQERYHFGITISKKIGKAVVRNKIKRRIKNIIDKKHYEKNFNCIIIVRKDLLNLEYNELEKNLINALKNLKLIKEK